MKLTMDLFYKQEETNQAMENMECWKTQEHLKECRKCAPVGNWKKIEEEFRKKFNPEIGSHDDDCECSDCVGVLDIDEVVNFFKPYFQEEMHEKAVEELEIDCQWENCSGGQYCDKHSLESKPESSWEDTYAKVLGMCCSGCDCGHCGIRRDIVNKIEKEAYERGRNDTWAEVERITKAELGTWAKESIGAKAVESVIKALKK